MKNGINKMKNGGHSPDVIQAPRDSRTLFHFNRLRLNNLFMEAARYPLVVVCAGAGYGKTSAVLDFAEEYQATTIWVQISERDNVGGRFWENFINTMVQLNKPFANAISKLGFPDTQDKLNHFSAIVREMAEVKRRIIVFDDFHFIESPSMIHFAENIIHIVPPGSSLILISRSTPQINTAGMVSRGQIFNISEGDLRFTESELAQYFRQMNISTQTENLREIMQDTEGWAFAINIIARSYQKAPGYGGYMRNAMKTNIFRLLEREAWDGISEPLQRFLVRLSLIDHLSIDLIALLAGGDEELIAELEKQSAYIRRDSYINAYLIHPLLLEFLATRQELLSDEQKRETYAIAGEWCNRNNFKIDAMSYYEKIGEYKSIVSILFDLPTQIPHDIAKYAADILERAPAEAFDTVEFLAIMHFRVFICQGLWQKSLELAEYYEAKYLNLPKEDSFRTRTLSSLYYNWGLLRGLMCLTDDRYDFDSYFEKFCIYVCEPVEPVILAYHCPGPWINGVGSSGKGNPEKYISALNRTHKHISHCFNGFQSGEDELACGELLFFQGDTNSAEALIVRALNLARDNKQFEIMHRALFYSLRIAVSQGNYSKSEQALKEMKAQLDENEYSNRFTNYDISVSWYYYMMGLPEKVSDWLKDSFSPYGHAGFIENYGNQMKARFCYMTRYYPPLLSYIREMKQRESFLFGRIEMLAIEACVHYKMKNKRKAYAALEEAYETASPNEILMPFIELGKDMRTLCSAALKDHKGKIPGPWLENVNRKAASYAKRQSHIFTENRQATGITDTITISPRETEILTDLSHGLSRTEIADSHNLSINTVKMVINNICIKLGAENLANLIRIATERKMI
ncbi:MAG: LuxR C-terminal-related transcriptional regulator [Treponema sp.]|jgi:LuxR family maltose regulon positive regulatory protein|nr:LuxR C-terminal-related transcriptional regulator [Treponema sp.]